jgi:hypothetical protein
MGFGVLGLEGSAKVLYRPSTSGEETRAEPSRGRGGEATGAVDGGGGGRGRTGT